MWWDEFPAVHHLAHFGFLQMACMMHIVRMGPTFFWPARVAKAEQEHHQNAYGADLFVDFRKLES